MHQKNMMSSSNSFTNFLLKSHLHLQKQLVASFAKYPYQIIIFYYAYEESSRNGFSVILVQLLDSGNAPGLQALSDEEKIDLRA